MLDSYMESGAGGYPEAAPDDALPPRSCPVRIHYRRPDVSGWLQLSNQWQVLPNQALLQELHQLCGPHAVSIAYRA